MPLGQPRLGRAEGWNPTEWRGQKASGSLAQLIEEPAYGTAGCPGNVLARNPPRLNTPWSVSVLHVRTPRMTKGPSEFGSVDSRVKVSTSVLAGLRNGSVLGRSAVSERSTKYLFN